MTIGERGRVAIAKALRDEYGLGSNAGAVFVDCGTGIRIVKRCDGARRGCAGWRHCSTRGA